MTSWFRSRRFSWGALTVGLSAAVCVAGLPIAFTASASTTPATMHFSVQPGTADPGVEFGTDPVVTVKDASTPTAQPVSGVDVTLHLQSVSDDNHRLAPTLACDDLTVTTDS